jgi:ATP-dependent DNA helicase RecG
VQSFLREKLEAGRQAYVVMARVEDDGGGEVRAVNRSTKEWQEALAPMTVAALHGRMTAEEKARVMAEFREGRVKVLVATSVIEVGIDVPNATIMVVENAEQFGLAQLHQLRGRIGRGGHDSQCILLTAKETLEIRERLGVLERTVDGFEIAEADLRLRGAGDLLGQVQSGLPPFRFADLAGDREILELARVGVASLRDWQGPPKP